MITDDVPPDIGEHETVQLPAKVYVPEDDRYRSPRPVDSGGEPASGYANDREDPYRSLGGLSWPDAYAGTRDFDCPTCKAKKGDKCTVWVELLKRRVVRKMPCLARIQLAKERGLV